MHEIQVIGHPTPRAQIAKGTPAQPVQLADQKKDLCRRPCGYCFSFIGTWQTFQSCTRRRDVVAASRIAKTENQQIPANPLEPPPSKQQTQKVFTSLSVSITTGPAVREHCLWSEKESIGMSPAQLLTKRKSVHVTQNLDFEYILVSFTLALQHFLGSRIINV